MRAKSNLVALAAIATFGGALAQGVPGTPSTGPASSSPSASPSTPAAGGSGYLTAPDKPSKKSEISKPGDKFGTLDKDHDGMVSKAEARKDTQLKSQFDALDGNKDGKLDQSEFAQFEVGSVSNQQK